MATRPSRPRATTPAPARPPSGRAGRDAPSRRSSRRSATRRHARTCAGSSRTGSSTGWPNRRPLRPRPSAVVDEDARLGAQLLGPALDLGVQLALAHELTDLLGHVVVRRNRLEAARARLLAERSVVIGVQLGVRRLDRGREALPHEVLERHPPLHERGELVPRRARAREDRVERLAALLDDARLESRDAGLDLLALRLDPARLAQLALPQHLDDARREDPLAIRAVRLARLARQIAHAHELSQLALEDEVVADDRGDPVEDDGPGCGR